LTTRGIVSSGRRAPYERELSDLIGELSTRCDEFPARWAAHNVQIYTTEAWVSLTGRPEPAGEERRDR
jgi:hypothetical protein